MKKTMFALMMAAVLLFAAAPLFAEGITLGGKIGGNFTNIVTEDAGADTNTKLGIIGGAFMCYNFTEIFAIQPELLFSMKGAEVAPDSATKYNYLEIPLLLKVSLPTEGKIKPSIFAGPSFGLLLSAKDEFDEDVKECAKSYDIGIVAGIGIGYELDMGTFFIEGRYEVGLTSISDLSDEQLKLLKLTEQPDVKNSALSAMVGFSFAL